MPVLTIITDSEIKEISFEGNAPVDRLLSGAGIILPHPCSGRGVCGKCAIDIEGEMLPETEAEKKAGRRLSCQTVLCGNAAVRINRTDMEIETGAGEQLPVTVPRPGEYGAAVDIGTTTVVLSVYDLGTGRKCAEVSCMNPQTAVSSDVMGRIGAAMNGRLEELRTMILNALKDLLQKSGYAGRITEMAAAGNTVMLYLLTGKDPSALSHAPFEADELFGLETDILGIPAFLPKCFQAFVGADISCAVLASGMLLRNETALLLDAGTNGELALLKNGKLYTASTALGPAFEGAGITMGTGSVPGAISAVSLEADGSIRSETIGSVSAVGICGSGIIDAVSVFLKNGKIDETGAVDEERLELRDGISLYPKDVRMVQLAKAAVAAGIETLLKRSETTPEEIRRFYVAGGFGAHLNVKNAAYIGMFPEVFADKTVVLGNASLSGAARLLLDSSQREITEQAGKNAVHCALGGDLYFNDSYIEHMMFDI